jgi:uncharacterized membrane protein YgaE (UPF0421/DUF939 family)
VSNAQKVESDSSVPMYNALFALSLSDKLKFSIKVSLSMALAYLIPISQGWSQASTAPITVMLIAAMGSVSESVMKGAMRVAGTVIGAVIGMTLIALFPQERMLYLFFLSITVAIPLYLVRAYKGDPSIFMLSAMTMMMVFKNGEVDDVFIYGLDKTYMTVFGIMIYTLVGVFVWPVDIEDTSTKNAIKLSQTQSELFLSRDDLEEKRHALLARLVENETLLEASTMDTNSTAINLQQWHSIIHNNKNINQYLTLLSMHDSERYVDHLDAYVPNFTLLESEISNLFDAIKVSWEQKLQINLSEDITLEYHAAKIKELSHMQRASLLTTVQEMQKLYQELRTLATKLNRIHSPLPTFFDIEEIPENKRFIWGDIEHLKGVLVTFIIFWAATFFWIEFNPAGGFMIVALATGLSVLTTFTPIKPSMLIIVITISFIFAILMYVAVLPHLRYGWQLGLFIFIYSFIAFHLINPKMTIFFLIGLFTFNIANTMYYDFAIFLLILLMFYLFLILLHIFYYVPFSTKPEHLFIVMKNRFFYLIRKMLERGRKEREGKISFFDVLAAKYSETHLMSTVKKMQLWANGIDAGYFDTLDNEKLLLFTKESEKFAYLVELLYHRDLEMKENPLLQVVSQNYTLPSLSDLLDKYTNKKKEDDAEDVLIDKQKTVYDIEAYLSKLLEDINFESYAKKDIAELYENIALRKNVWLSFFKCQMIMQELDFRLLEQSRF